LEAAPLGAHLIRQAFEANRERAMSNATPTRRIMRQITREDF